MKQPSAIEQQLAPLFIGTPYELVGVTVSTGSAKGSPLSTVRVFIDKLEAVEPETLSGISIEDITTVSRMLGAYLEVEQILTGHYTLEVSSPGLDRILFKPAHFDKQLGKKIQISLLSPIDHQRNFKGTLEKVEKESIDMLVEAKKGSEPTLQQFRFGDIDRARVIPDFTIGTSGKGKKEA